MRIMSSALANVLDSVIWFEYYPRTECNGIIVPPSIDCITFSRVCSRVSICIHLHRSRIILLCLLIYIYNIIIIYLHRINWRGARISAFLFFSAVDNLYISPPWYETSLLNFSNIYVVIGTCSIIIIACSDVHYCVHTLESSYMANLKKN